MTKAQRYILAGLLLLLLPPTTMLAQESSMPFKGTSYNTTYNIYLTINFYDKDIVIRGQEVLGAMDGYLGDYEDFRKWLIVAATVDSDNKAQLQIVNSEGSEDLCATLTYNGDGTYTLRQNSGSTMKIARQQKWVKLPKTLTFTKKK